MDNGWYYHTGYLNGWHGVPIYNEDIDFGPHKPTGFVLPDRAPSIDYIPDSPRA